jgi:non-heme chloroperoxidase
MHRRIVLVTAIAVTIFLAAGVAGADKQWKDQSEGIGDIKIHYLEGGTGDRHLVFIPGIAMNAEVWKEQFPYFTARGFHVIAMDPRSQGLSSKTEEGNSCHQWAADLHAFLKKLKLEHSTLIAWSAAVPAVLDYISSAETLHPDQIVLVDGAPAGLADNDFPGSITLQQAREYVLDLQEDRAKATDKYIRAMFKSPPPAYLIKELTEGSLKTPMGAAIALLFDVLTGDRRPALSVINVPTLVMVPEERRLLGEWMQSKISGSQLEVIPEAGHAMFLEKPQSFNQALENFLAKQ